MGSFIGIGRSRLKSSDRYYSLLTIFYNYFINYILEDDEGDGMEGKYV